VPWGQKIDLFRRLFFPVVYGAIVKAQQLSVAMEARGFQGLSPAYLSAAIILDPVGLWLNTGFPWSDPIANGITYAISLELG